jgi:hypothetical protein
MICTKILNTLLKIQNFFKIVSALNTAQKKLIKKTVNVLNVILVVFIVLRTKIYVLHAPLV